MTATSFELNEASFTQAIKNELEGELTEDELQGVLDELGYDTIDEYISDNYSTLADELEDKNENEFKEYSICHACCTDNGYVLV